MKYNLRDIKYWVILFIFTSSEVADREKGKENVEGWSKRTAMKREHYSRYCGSQKNPRWDEQSKLFYINVQV